MTEVVSGNDEVALDTNQVRGPGSYQPSYKLDVGYKFSDGSVVTFGWMHMFQIRYAAVATSLPHNFAVGGDFANSFVTAPVFNFPHAQGSCGSQMMSAATSTVSRSRHRSSKR